MTNNYTQTKQTTRVFAKWLFVAFTVLIGFTNANAQITVTGCTGGGNGSYTTLGAAITAIGTAQPSANILLTVSGNTTEGTSSIVIGAGTWTTFSIQPTGGSFTITAATTAGSPMIDLNGADNLRIDGINSGGNYLTIQNTTASATSGTSTIRFQTDATNNTITNCAILGSSNSATATNGGNIWFASGAVSTGNDNNTVSNCNIGPAGSNLPTKCIYFTGTSNTDPGTANSGITINNNNIFDFFSATASSAGIDLNSGTTNITISNNRFYQSATRTQTSGVAHRAININNSSANNVQVTGNTIGYSSSAGTGTYNFVGIASSTFIPIFFSVGTTTACTATSNTVTAIAVSGAMSGTSSSAAFRGIYVSAGLTTCNSNVIGSISANNAITYTSSSTSASDVIGLFNFGSSAWTTNSNQVGGITVANSSTGAANLYGIRCNTGSTVTWTCNNNIIGGSLANSMQSTATTTATVVNGILNSNPIITATGNLIRNLTCASTSTGTGVLSAIVGLAQNGTTTTTLQTVSSNTIHTLTLSNASTTAAIQLTGLFMNGGAVANVVSKNNMHSFTATAVNPNITITGIDAAGGTNTYSNNMIRLGLNPDGTSLTTALTIRGISLGTASTNNFYHNSIYIGGSGVGTTANHTRAFNQTSTGTRDIRNNIFANSRSNSTTGGKHYSFFVSSATGITLNNNIYNYNGTGGVFATTNGGTNDVAAYSSNWVSGDASSFTLDPQFITPNGSASTGDLHINSAVATPVEGLGVAIGSITDDIDGNVRASNTPADIGADAGNFTALSVVVINSVSANPAAGQCTATSHTVSANITAGAGDITSVTLNYSFNGTAQTPITMTGGTLTANTTSTFTAVIPAATPTNATVAWSVSAVDATTTKNTAGTSYVDDPNNGATATASASVNPVCSGNTTSLSVEVAVSGGNATIGTGATLTGATTQPTAFCNRWPSYRMQTLYTAAELQAAGLRAGNITAMSFSITTLGDGATNSNFRVKIGNSALTALSTFADTTSGFTTVVNPQVYTHTASGLQTITFNTPYNWNGTSNIIVQMVHNGANSTNNSITYYTATTNTMTLYTATAATNAASLSNQRLNVRFTGVAVSNAATSYAWSNGVSTFTTTTTNTVSVSPTANTTYSVAVTVAGCPVNSNNVAVTVTPLPTAPTATNSSQCGTQVPAAFVTGTGGATFKWYNAASGGTALQTSTSTTYTTAVSTSTTFYVTEVGAGACESSPRTAVNVSVQSPDPITVTPSSFSVCPFVPFTISASYTPDFNSFATFDITATGGSNSGIVGTVSGTTNATGMDPYSVTANAPGTYVYTVSAFDPDKGCISIGTTTVTVLSGPTINTPTASPATICPAASSTLTATTNVISSGNVQIGTGSTLTGATTQPTAFCNRWPSYRMQMLFTAAELSAQGLSAGNITAMSFSTTTLGDGATNSNFRVKIGNSALTALSTFADTTSGFTTVVNPQVFTHTASGLQTITFNTPYNWNGTSNIIVQMVHNGADLTNNSITYYTATTNTMTLFTSTAATNAASLSNQRLNTIFSGQTNAVGAGSLNWVWNAGTNTTGNNVTVVNPTTTTTYTISANDPAASPSCVSKTVVTVSVNPAPSAPTSSNSPSVQCGTQVPTVAVTDPNSFTTPTFKWYSASTGGSLLQSSTATTYTTAVSASTSFYVSVTNPSTGCESARTQVDVTVNTPDAIVAAASVTQICLGGTTNLSVSVPDNTNGNTYTYAWTASGGTASGITGTLNGGTQNGITPTAAGTYIYTVTGTDGGCVTTSTVSVSVGVIPTITAITASPATICSGNTSVISAGSVNASAGTATIGTGSTLTGATTQPTAFCNRWPSYRMQMLFTAAELSAQGLLAGNITAMSFSTTTLGDGATNSNFRVKIGNSALTALSTFVDTTSGFTTVVNPQVFTHTASGLQTITFNTPYNWNGTSNIIVQMVHNGADATNNSITYYTATTNTMTLFTATAATNAASLSNQRLNTRFAGQVGQNLTSNYTWNWNPGNLTGATQTVTPTTTTNYTVSAYSPGTPNCATTATVTVNVNPTPSAPSISGVNTVCGTSTTVLTASAPTAGGTIKWYNAATLGTLLGTGQTFTTSAVTATTVYYAAEETATCPSTRTSYTVTWSAAPTITASNNHPAAFCGPDDVTGFGPVTLTVSSTNDPAYVYTWSTTTGGVVDNGSGNASATLSSAVGYTSSAAFAATYTVTGYNSGTGCSTSATTQLVQFNFPAFNATASPSSICTAGTATLSPGVSSSNFSVASTTYNPALTTAATSSITTIVSGGVANVTLSGGSLDDGGWSGIPIGFNYNFFGNSFTTISAGTNGLLMFGTPPGYGTGAGQLGQFSFTLTPAVFPNAGNPGNVIALLAHDANFSGTGNPGNIKYWNDGVAPLRRFIIEYNSFPNYNGFDVTTGPQSTVQCILYESTGLVEIHVTNASASTPSTTEVNARKTIGLQDATMTIGAVAPGRQARAAAITTPEAWRFTPPVNYTFAWTPNPGFLSAYNVSEPVATPTVTTTYSVAVTDPTTSCIKYDNVTLTVVPVPAAPTTTGAAICGAGAVTLTASGSPSLDWYNAATAGTLLTSGTSFTPTISATTTYYVESNNGACANVGGRTPVTATVNPVVIMGSVSATPLSTCVGASSTLTAVASVGSAPTYCSTSNDGTSIITNVRLNTLNSSPTAQTATPFYHSNTETTSLVAGTPYTVSVTCNASAIVSVWIDANQNGTYEASEWVQPYISASTGSTTINIPTSAYNGATGMRVRSRSSGNANGSGDACLSMGSGSTEDYVVTITGATANPVTTITSSGYTWTGGTFSSSIGSTVTATGITGTTIYTVTATSAANCSAVGTVTVSTIAPPTGSAANTTICSGQTTSIALSGGSTYTWVGSGNGATSGTASPIAQQLINASNTSASTTTYTVTPYSSEGCVGEDFTVNVLVNPAPTGSASNVSICSGETTSIALSSAGSTFTWSASNTGVVNATGTNFSCSNNCGTTIESELFNSSSTDFAVLTYTVIPTSALSCQGVPFTVSATVKPKPEGSVTSIVPSATICSGNTVTINLGTGVSGTNLFTWTPSAISGTTSGTSGNVLGPNKIVATINNTNSSSNASVVQYEIVPTANGCEGDAFYTEITINKRSTAATTLNASIPSVCVLASSTTLTATNGSLGTGAYWEWHKNASFTSLVNYSYAANASLVVTPTVTTTYYLRSVGNLTPCTGTVNATTAVTVTVTSTAPGTPGAINGPTFVCGLTTATYSVAALGGMTYNWTLRPGMSNMQNLTPSGNRISVDIDPMIGTPLNGYLQVTATNACGTSAIPRQVWINLTPGTPGSIVGNTKVCGLTTMSYSCVAISTATTYNWTLPSGMVISAGAGTNMITATRTVPLNTSISGNVTVTTQNGCGTGVTKSLAVSSTPNGVIASISGPSSVCSLLNTNVTYSVAAIAGATAYQWSIPTGINLVSGQGTNVLVVQPTSSMASQASLGVYATNGCSNTATKTMLLIKIPQTAASITGPTDVCNETIVSYSCPTVNGATSYNWVVPSGVLIVAGAGTNAIDVDVTTFFGSGLVKVAPTNACGTASGKSLSISGCVAPVAPNSNNLGNNNAVQTASMATSIIANVYPNPTIGNFSIEIDSKVERTLEIEVYDMLGNQVISKQEKVGEGVSKYDLNIEGNHDGVYLIRVTDKDRKELFKSNIVKQ
jgi:PKD-like domain/Ig-like domain CHU_C associated/GEVED domain/Secretion system C-terminal sorting domain